MSKKVGSINQKDLLSQQARQKEQLKVMKKMDVTGLKEQIHSLREQLKHLINQKIYTEKQMQTKNEQYMNKSYDLEKIAKTQQQEIIQLQSKLKILRNTFSQAQKKKKLEHTQQIQSLTDKRQSQQGQLLKVQQTLSKKVQYLKRFRQRQLTYQQTISKLQQRKQYLKLSQTKDIQKIKNSFQSKRTQIKEITHKQIQTIQALQVDKIRQKLSKQQQIKRENQIMEDQIDLCEQQKVIVLNQLKLLSQDVKKKKSDDSSSLLGSQAAETYQRSLRVIKLEGKMNKLKQFMNDQLKRLDEELNSLDRTCDQTQKQISQRTQKLKNSLQLKQRDLKKVKACSQMVLNQRSSLEAYLLQVFYQNPQLNYKLPANVNQVLRKLFVKINSKKTPLTYKNYINSDPTGVGTNSADGDDM